jgi:hypothetical protein
MKTKITSIAIFAVMFLATLVLDTNIAIGQAVSNDLVSYWTLDEKDINGKIVKDKMGRNDGEMIGAPGIVAGKFGNGLKLNGTADYIKVSSLNISPAVYSTITLMAWIYPTSDGTGGQGNRRFVFAHDDGGWDRGMLIQTSNWRLGTGNDGTDYWDTGVAVGVNAWQHVAMVYSEKNIEFYKDGAKSSYGTPGKIDAGNPFLLIGTHPSQARFFQGTIDEIYVYSRALSEAEIRKNMNASGMAVESAYKLSISWGNIKVMELTNLAKGY